MEIEEALRQAANRRLDANSRHSFLAAYSMTYLYRYIKQVEIAKVQEIIKVNHDLSAEEAVDFYITTLLYADWVDANPGLLLTYADIDDVPTSRVEALRAARESILVAVRDSDDRALFQSIFMLMTYYVGSSYRRVHDAVVSILDMEMSDFRTLFFDNLDTVIEKEGKIRIRASL